MHHEAFEDLSANVTIFREIAMQLETGGLHLDHCDAEPGHYYSFLLDQIQIENLDGSFELINMDHWLFIYSGDDSVSQVEVSMEFDGHRIGYGPAIHVRHRADTWKIVSEVAASRMGSDYTASVFQSAREAELRGLLKLQLGEEPAVTREQAFDAIRVMAEFFLKTKAASAASQKTG